jgi:hypothetical protein
LPLRERDGAFVGRKGGAQRADGAVVSRFRGADRDADHDRDVGEREVRVIDECKEGPLVVGQSTEGTFDLVPVGGRALQVVGGPRVGRSRVRQSGREDLGDVPALVSAGLPVARPDEEAMQPGIELVRVSEAADVAPRLHERVLDGVVGTIRVPEDQPGGRIEAEADAGGERREGLSIASLGPGHELRLHLSHSSRSAVKEQGAATAVSGSIFPVLVNPPLGNDRPQGGDAGAAGEPAGRKPQISATADTRPGGPAPGTPLEGSAAT